MELTKKNSMKVERTFADILIKNKVSFKFREVIEGREVDFIIGRVAIELDGVHHLKRRASEVSKNEILVRLGYTPLHFSAKEVKNNAQAVLREIKRLVGAKR